MKFMRGLLFVFLAVSIWGCRKEAEKNEKPAEASTEKPSNNESRVKHGTNGEVTITIETNLQQTIGLQTAELEPAQLSPQVKAYGQVMDPSGLAALVGDLATAQAAQQASEAELKRLKTLAAQNNASERAVQTAEAAAVHDQAQVQSVRLKLLAAWGGAISQRSDLPEFVQSLGSLSSALVQLQVPAGDAPTAMPVSSRIFPLGDESRPVEAQIIGPASVVDPQMQGRGFILLVSPNAGHLAPGAAVMGYLGLPGDQRAGVLMPRSAVIRFSGSTWIYLKTAPDTFQRQQVLLDSPQEKGWFVAAGLKPKDQVVTVGAQQLLSEELKGQGGGEE